MYGEGIIVRGSIAQIVIVAAALAIGVTGCQSTKSTDMSEPPSGAGGFTSGEAVEPSGSVDISSLKTVYFDFDKSNIRGDQQKALREDGQVILASPKLGKLTLEGNTDERGSQEYNLALGERRANAVKRYLVDLGVPASRFRTVSFGEDRPAVPGHDDSAGRWNRRVDFAVSR